MCSSLGQLDYSIPLMTHMNLESVKSRGQCIKDQILGPRLLSNVYVCSIYLGKNYLFMRKILLTGAILEVGA